MLDDIRRELIGLKNQGLYRQLRQVDSAQGGRVIMDGREIVLLCSNNYLGLANHPFLKEAAIRATEIYGVGSGAARLVSGSMELHKTLEQRIADFKGAEAALLFNSGYAANTGVISSLVGKGDLIFSDRLNHASIIDGAVLSRAKLHRYQHNDMNSLRSQLERYRSAGRSLIVTDGVFSMDGDIARLPELVQLKNEFGCMLMVDDAHATGVLGPSGKGSAELFGLSGSIDIHMGTLGKAVGSFGAYVAGKRELLDYLINRARSFIFSTSLPPSVLAASIAAFDLIDSTEGALLRDRLHLNSITFRDGLKSCGFDTLESATQIVPILTGDANLTMEFSSMLLEDGYFVQGIRPPTVPAGTSRLRCAIMATHTDEDLSGALKSIERAGARLGVPGHS